MFYLDYQDMVTDGLIEILESTSSPPLELERDELQDVLIRIFSELDTFPVFDRELGGSEITALSVQTLADAITSMLNKSGYAHVQYGFVIDSPTDGSSPIVHRRELTPINVASVAQLEMLPGVGSKLAESIIVGRQFGGPYKSIEDLIDRVDGIGEKTGAEIEHALSFRFPEANFRSLPVTRDLGQAIGLLASLMPGVDPASKLMSALDQVATALAADSPIGPARIPRLAGHGTERAEFQSNAVRTLMSFDYFKVLPTLLDAAESSIDVCMFHIALPTQQHPTRKLLDALRSAHSRGVEVRVLVDRDRATDPYQSTVINSPARDFLNEEAELCRFDDEAELLHSKYVVIDERLVVIGSHNWSAGSFFQFDDLSVVVDSADYARHTRTSFHALWTEVEDLQ